MLRVKSQFHTNQISLIPLNNRIRKPQTFLKPSLQFLPVQTHSVSRLQLKSRRKNSRGFNASFSEGGGDGDAGGEDDMRKKGNRDGAPRLNLRWNELLLVPDRDNVVAVGLTGALAWASAHVLWQLFVVTTAILVAAIKYTFVGVLLIFLLITLL